MVVIVLGEGNGDSGGGCSCRGNNSVGDGGDSAG